MELVGLFSVQCSQQRQRSLFQFSQKEGEPQGVGAHQRLSFVVLFIPSLGARAGCNGKLQLLEKRKVKVLVTQSFVDKTQKVLGELGEAIWIQLEEREVLLWMQSFYSLVWWAEGGDFGDLILDLNVLNTRVVQNWQLWGRVTTSLVGGSFILFDFPFFLFEYPSLDDIFFGPQLL